MAPEGETVQVAVKAEVSTAVDTPKTAEPSTPSLHRQIIHIVSSTSTSNVEEKDVENEVTSFELDSLEVAPVAESKSPSRRKISDSLTNPETSRITRR